MRRALRALLIDLMPDSHRNAGTHLHQGCMPPSIHD
jgi:hypothetical protein